MLSYRHLFHAGNFGDVLKHSVLALLVEALKQKPAPFFYLDTHAGVGRYSLTSEQAAKTGEFRQGIARLWGRGDLPGEFAPYRSSVEALNSEGRLVEYPGSPRVVRHLLRPGDKMHLCELHSSDYPELKREFAGDRQVSVHHMDGYQALKALLPPKERRGLVHIDPSYEVKGEYGQAAAALISAHGRWATGVYALWYPVLAEGHWRRMIQQITGSGIRKILLAELNPLPADSPTGLNGSGMLVINPPWHLDEGLRRLLPPLWEALSPPGKGGGWRVEWLVSE